MCGKSANWCTFDFFFALSYEISKICLSKHSWLPFHLQSLYMFVCLYCVWMGWLPVCVCLLAQGELEISWELRHNYHVFNFTSCALRLPCLSHVFQYLDSFLCILFLPIWLHFNPTQWPCKNLSRKFLCTFKVLMIKTLYFPQIQTDTSCMTLREKVNLYDILNSLVT